MPNAIIINWLNTYLRVYLTHINLCLCILPNKYISNYAREIFSNEQIRLASKITELPCRTTHAIKITLVLLACTKVYKFDLSWTFVYMWHMELLPQLLITKAHRSIPTAMSPHLISKMVFQFININVRVRVACIVASIVWYLLYANQRLVKASI